MSFGQGHAQPSKIQLSAIVNKHLGQLMMPSEEEMKENECRVLKKFSKQMETFIWLTSEPIFEPIFDVPQFHSDLYFDW